MNTANFSDIIKDLRKQKGLTQNQLASLLNVSNKTISKWETGKGLPDITIFEAIAKIFNISITELFNGIAIKNKNLNCNMLKTLFYVCPVCGNIINSNGEASISCHGLTLSPLKPQNDTIEVKYVEDELYINLSSPMTKQDYISFIAGMNYNSIQLIKLYPESTCEARLKRNTKYIYYYSTTKGLFKCKV